MKFFVLKTIKKVLIPVTKIGELCLMLLHKNTYFLATFGFCCERNARTSRKPLFLTGQFQPAFSAGSL